MFSHSAMLENAYSLPFSCFFLFLKRTNWKCLRILTSPIQVKTSWVVWRMVKRRAWTTWISLSEKEYDRVLQVHTKMIHQSVSKTALFKKKVVNSVIFLVETIMAFYSILCKFDCFAIKYSVTPDDLPWNCNTFLSILFSYFIVHNNHVALSPMYLKYLHMPTLPERISAAPVHSS